MTWLDVGGAGGRKDQGFGVGIDVAVAVVQHQGAQLFADRGAARLPGPQHREAVALRAVRRPAAWVDLPAPSPPSKAMNSPLALAGWRSEVT